MHVLLLIPFYVFSAIAVFLILSLLCRVLRLAVTANAVAVTSVVLGLGVVAVPLLTNALDLEHYAGRYLLALGAFTFVLAALDTVLEPLLPLALDRELEHS